MPLAEHQRTAPLWAQANTAAYFALLKPGDTVLAMKLDQGGTSPTGFNFSRFTISCSMV